MFTLLTKMCCGRTVPRMVTIQFQPFRPYMNLALKNSYGTGIRLSNIITGHIIQDEHFRP